MCLVRAMGKSPIAEGDHANQQTRFMILVMLNISQ